MDGGGDEEDALDGVGGEGAAGGGVDGLHFEERSCMKGGNSYLDILALG